MLDKQLRQRNKKRFAATIPMRFYYASAARMCSDGYKKTDCNSPLNINYTRIIEIYARVRKIILKKYARNKINCE